MNLQNPNSHLTAKERDSLSFPARFLLNKKLLIGSILDYGCGFGSDVRILNEKGLNIEGYDKYYFPEFPQKKYDTVICIYVLNVLLQEEQTNVLMDLSRLVESSGKVYIAVRRDVNYEGFRMHKVHQKKTYQCNVVLNFKSIFRNDSCEIYEYQHFNQTNRTNENNCPFCNPEFDREIIVESALSYAIYDKFPVSNGHVLIIPKRHISDYFELTFKEQIACVLMLKRVKEIVSEIYKPDGFNIGINIGERAGQTVPHVHLHLIPRYKGDVPDPKGGVRGVIPNKKTY